MVLRAAVLTVSDTAAQDSASDRSGPAIRQILAGREVLVADEDHAIVSDDVEGIRRAVRAWTGRDGARKIDWIITTGGTGFGARDVTPEAISPLITRQAPGLVHLLLGSSLKQTPLAALSRPVAGTIGDTLITTLPGSVKAVTENLEALFNGGVIDHAIDLITGGSGKDVHAAMGSGHHHHHNHSHHPPQPRSSAALSHDPTAPASARHRHSPYPILSLEEALKIIDDEIRPLPAETRPVDHNLRGYILAEDVHAPQDAPITSTTSVDGYALRSTDPPGVYKVVTSSSSYNASEPLPTGTVYRINTGAPLPAGADTVIMVEDTRLVSTYNASDAGTNEVGEEKEVETLAQVPPGENVRYPGSDVKKGDLVMKKGEKVLSGGGEIGSLSFVGRTQVSVYKKPVVAVLSTGNEIVDLHQPSTSGESTQRTNEWKGIFDTNRPSLRAALEGLGYTVIDLGIVPDRIDAHVEALQKGLNAADLIISTGGTSMGPSDLLKPVIERNLGGTVHFGRVAIKPGKPTTFATVSANNNNNNDNKNERKPMFALPGNPASALVTFYIFVFPALRKLAGWAVGERDLPRVRVQVQTPMPFDPRTEFHRVVVRVDRKTGVLGAWSTGGQRSSRVASLQGANGLVVVRPPREGEGGLDQKKGLGKGDWAEAALIGELEVV